jgi:hypothetical protein
MLMPHVLIWTTTNKNPVLVELSSSKQEFESVLHDFTKRALALMSLRFVLEVNEIK